MPIATCGQTTVLTGQDGMITMKPPGTSVCLKDKTDFPAGVAISIPATSDFRVGDPVTFAEKGTANIDANITPGTVYYIKSRPTLTTVQIAATSGGAAITLAGDGGAGGADTPGAGNHIEMTFANAYAMCEVPSVTLTITRGEVDRTAIPCKPGPANGAPKMAQFRAYQPGFADGNGTITLRLTEDMAAFNNRIIQGALFNDQSGAVLKAYFNAVATSGGLTVDDTASLYSEFPVVLLGFDTGISQEDSPTEFSVNYRVAGQPTHLLGLTY
jgi:hypothetical protein